MKYFASVALGLICITYVQLAISDTLEIPSALWSTLSQSEKFTVSNAFDINLITAMSFGLIIDAQTFDSSTRGTSGGAQLGSAFASAAYIDSAFKNEFNYSAKKDIGVSLLGAMLGSAADSAPDSVFRTRYSIQLQEGNIQYVVETTSSPFRHSIGICVLLSPLRQASQGLCGMTKTDLLAAVAKDKRPIRATSTPSIITPIANEEDQIKVLCSIGANSATLLPKSICLTMGGLAN